MNRRTIALLLILLLALVGLFGFYLYLSGGTGSEQQTDTKTAEGLVHVRTIYTADGENLRRPVGLGATDNGDFYVTLKDNSRVIGFDRRGNYKVKWGEQGIKQGELLAPLAVAANRLANQVYVIDRARLRVISYDTNGKFLWERPVLNPVGIGLLNDDITVTTFGPIVRLTAEGEPVSESGSRGFDPGEFDYPRALVQASRGSNVIVADTNNARVSRVGLNGEATATVIWTQGQPPRNQNDVTTKFGVPSGVTIGQRDRVFVLDGFRHKIDVLDQRTGEIVHTFADLEGKGAGQFNLPTQIVNLGGDYFAITDTYNDRVQIVRLLLPGDDNFVARRPWVLYLLPLLLLPLLLLLLRRRVYVTREALRAAADDGNLRLIAGAFRRLYVLPEVASDFADTVEEDVAIGQFLFETGERASAIEAGRADAPPEPGAAGVTAAPVAEDEEHRLAAAAGPALWRRLGAPRRLVIAADEAQIDRMGQLGRSKVRGYAWVLEEYRIDG